MIHDNFNVTKMHYFNRLFHKGLQVRGEVRKVRKNLLEKTGKWEDKLPKLTCKTKIEAKEKKWHLTTKHTLIPLHT